MPSYTPLKPTDAQPFLTHHSDVPLEVWGEIFFQVASNPKINTAGQVQILCLVSKAWREAALTVPKIWANLQIDDVSLKTNFEKVGAWLARSGGMPKSLALDENWGGHRTCALPGEGLAKLFIEGPALDTLSFRCFSVECLQEIFTIWQTPSAVIEARGWDSLRTIDLKISSWGDNPHQPVFLQHLPPALGSLSLRLPYWQDVPSGEPPPAISHPSLASLNLECDFAPSWIVETVMSCPKLDSLTLHLDPFDGDPHGPPFDMTKVHRHTNLRSLHLKQRHLYNPYTEILQPLVLPSMVELGISLDLRDGYEDTEEVMGQLQSMIGRLALHSEFWIHLRTFRLHGPFDLGGNGIVDLTAIFRAIPSVTHVALDKIDFDPPSLFSQGSELLPNLKTLELFGMSDTFDDGALLPFVQERKSRDTGFTFIFERASERPPSPPARVYSKPFRVQNF